uniref:Anthranilate synthase component 1 n=1 Tax=Candidatus Kentrum eta TaxID=2126337 RepID=A0A450UFS6_9GAMM|nr:MAG: anthranilate synthase component 1 [Candidatus Kentron sp. H]VFJ91344.1 MAG: anthranilate synthase component 1 [Candidatus Kentron sp. H]VFJ97870.1 MAG: anthranilate synthase component 1 [Candidatus Kentron sp. H]
MTTCQGTPLWQKIDACPDLLSIHSSKPDRYPFLLESTLQGAGSSAGQSRYDILFAFPEGRLVLEASGYLTRDGRRIPGGDFLHELDAWADDIAAPGAATMRSSPLEIPFRGGWFLYFGYELAGEIEPVLHSHLTENLRNHADSIEAEFPIAAAWRVPAAIIRDKQRRETILVVEPSHAARMADLKTDLLSAKSIAESPSLRATDAPRAALPWARLREDPAEEFLERVARIKHYIREGDVFQVNLSRAWRGRLPTDIPSARIYHRLRQRNPAAFAGLAVWDDLAIVSSSPERLVRIHDGMVETRPIAGTHPRHRDLATDRGLSEALMAHPKERAEHIMLIDLERNDLGRVCQPGSVRVDELMVLESYAHVHHIVSNIRGRLLSEATPGRVLRAVFPGGTITGCPKVRCMEIIAELEQAPRGPYTGAMGYLNRDGDADLNILIRTLCRQGDRLSLRAGAGIVADSQPERELKETRHKARGPLNAL